jgi:mono/diheme cytochrome c family protein
MRWFKVLLRIVGVLVVLLLVVIAVVYGLSSREIHRTYNVTSEPLTIPTDSASIIRGKHLVTAIGKCGDCHGDNFGGKAFIDDPMFGHIYAKNLTRGKGGVGGTLSAADIARVLRYGVKPDGQSVLFMPVSDYTQFNDADLGAIVAYIRTLPPVDHTVPSSSLGPIGRMLVVSKKVPELLPSRFIVGKTIERIIVPPGPTAAYGAYLARVGGCQGCHGAKLAGGPVPGGPPDWPPAANLTPTGIGQWTEADFTRALRQGVAPGGVSLNTAMPWKYTRYMTDDEIHAVWAYLQTLPPTPYNDND